MATARTLVRDSIFGLTKQTNLIGGFGSLSSATTTTTTAPLKNLGVTAAGSLSSISSSRFQLRSDGMQTSLQVLRLASSRMMSSYHEDPKVQNWFAKSEAIRAETRAIKAKNEVVKKKIRLLMMAGIVLVILLFYIQGEKMRIEEEEEELKRKQLLEDFEMIVDEKMQAFEKKMDEKMQALEASLKR